MRMSVCFVEFLCLCLVGVVAFAGTETAQGDVVLQWWFQDAKCSLSNDGGTSTLVEDVGAPDWFDGGNSFFCEAECGYPDVGSAVTELQAEQILSGDGVVTVSLEASLDLWAESPLPGAANQASGYAYFQLAAVFSEQEYEMDLAEELNEPAEFWMTQADHFVNRAPESTFSPSTDPVLLLWGGLDYTCLLDFENPGGWGGHADTNLTVTLTPIPEPAITWCLLLGVGLVTRARRARSQRS